MKHWLEFSGEVAAIKSGGSSAGVLYPVTHNLPILNLCSDKDRAWLLDLSQYAWPDELADTPRRTQDHQPK